MKSNIAIGTLTLALAACTTGTRPAVGAAPARLAAVGLERVIGQDAGGLTRLFGQPDQEVREGTARKLQFASGICVLDAYLYPKGGQAPRVTWLDARQPDGRAIDRASCVAALTRRDGGR
ncbi:MAG: hypothetical protein JWN21_1621 [Sphingomonas bacterium]|uniref:hypothetical protein n=1 Tax=Sphingomonas bacterium TaxID=1895847 RepID=UPI002610991A|nr:hypothetical protein [Sphingomonas bacterium]MDB5696078.1 hypothetical protein [Sphingomonas bacterium]